jgi:HK97 gp10 family phage protein
LAKCEVKLPDELFEKLATLGNKTDKIVKEMLEAGGKVVLSAVKVNLSSVIGRGLKKKPRSTGELLGSIGVSPARVDRNGISNVKVGFNEPRKRQYKSKNIHIDKYGLESYNRSYYSITNAMIAGTIEYGKVGQPPKPFMKPTEKSSKGACIKAMEAKFNEEVGNF